MPASTEYLVIAEPCSENWAQMAPTACGRFCQACQKEVLDFSGLAPADILAVLRARPGGSVCGRLPADTLTASRQQAEARARRQWAWPGSAGLQRVLAILSLPLLPTPALLAAPAPVHYGQPSGPAQPLRLVQVRVLDPVANSGLGFARVQLWQADTLLLTAQAEADGTVQLAVPAEAWLAALRMTVELPGFQPAEQPFSPAELRQALAVPLTRGPVRLPLVREEGIGSTERTRYSSGALSVVTYKRPSLAKRLLVYPPWRLYLRAKRGVQNGWYRLRN